MTFLSTGPSLARALAERNYHESTPVQAAVTAEDAAGRDLLVSAQTGSGKTVAYGLAIADQLLEGAEKLPKAGLPLALIVAPTRELALQVHGELTWLYKYAGARVVSCVGGMDPRKEQRELAEHAYERARSMLAEREDLLEKLALVLLDRETLDQTEVEEILGITRLSPTPLTSDKPKAEVAAFNVAPEPEA